MEKFNPEQLKNLFKPGSNSHKGQNGRLLIIGGSHLFHGASLWALEVASRIVDMVFYSSVPENNEIVQKAKEEFRNGIIVSRDKLDQYVEEADCILIGPGLPRPEGIEPGDDDTKELTERLLVQYKNKKWVIDGGSLQVIDPSIIPKNAILTPHHQEFERLFGSSNKMLKPFGLAQGGQVQHDKKNIQDDMVGEMVRKYECIILLKGST